MADVPIGKLSILTGSLGYLDRAALVALFMSQP